jgi:hypothetical protein
MRRNGPGLRALLYSLLAGLAAVTALAVVVGETTEGSCAVICDWEVFLAVAGLAAFFGFCLVAVLIALYEARRVLRERRGIDP